MKLKLKKKWKWIAMDKEGLWCLFIKKPSLDGCIWEGGHYRGADQNVFNLPKAKDWTKSLQRIEQ